MKTKSLDQAIEYVLSLNSPVLFHKGENFATFDCSVYGLFDLKYSYTEKKWWAFKTHGSYNKGYIYQTLFYID